MKLEKEEPIVSTRKYVTIFYTQCVKINNKILQEKRKKSMKRENKNNPTKFQTAKTKSE